MSVQSEINRISSNVQDTYSELNALGATMPAARNSNNLAAAAASLSGVYVPQSRKVAGKTLASDIQILMEDLSNWALVSDVMVSDVTYHTYWLIAPTADNDVYGWAIHPNTGKMYLIRNNKGTYTATDYSANTNTQMRSYRTSTNVELPLAALSTGTTTSAWAEPSAGSYKAAYGCVCNSTAKRATMNPSTGKMTFNNDVELKGALSGAGFSNAVNALIDAKLAALDGNGVSY